MDSGKNIIMLAGAIATRFEGTATLAIKKQSGLSGTEGRWKFFRGLQGEDDVWSIFDRPKWQDTSGKLAGGGGGKGPFFSGSVNNAQDGFLSGHLQISDAS